VVVVIIVGVVAAVVRVAVVYVAVVVAILIITDVNKTMTKTKFEQHIEYQPLSLVVDLTCVTV